MVNNSSNAPTLRPQHNIRRAETLSDELCFHSRIFYIRQSDERVDLGEVISFKTEFEANLDLAALNEANGVQKSLESIYGSKNSTLRFKCALKRPRRKRSRAQIILNFRWVMMRPKRTLQRLALVNCFWGIVVGQAHSTSFQCHLRQDTLVRYPSVSIQYSKVSQQRNSC